MQLLQFSDYQYCTYTSASITYWIMKWYCACSVASSSSSLSSSESDSYTTTRQWYIANFARSRAGRSPWPSFLQFGRAKVVPLATPAKYSRVIGRVHIVGYYRPRKVYIVARTNRMQYLAPPLSRAGEVITHSIWWSQHVNNVAFTSKQTQTTRHINLMRDID